MVTTMAACAFTRPQLPTFICGLLHNHLQIPEAMPIVNSVACLYCIPLAQGFRLMIRLSTLDAKLAQDSCLLRCSIREAIHL